MKVYYAAGPGDVVTTFRHWIAGDDDPSEVAKTYSRQFFDLIAERGAAATVVSTCSRIDAESRGAIAVSHRPLPAWTKRGRGGYAIGQCLAGFRLLRDLLRYRPDVAVINEGTAPWIFLLPASLLGIQIVPALHCVLWTGANPPSGLRRRLDRFAFRRAVDSCLCVSDRVAAQVAELTDATVPTYRFFPTYQPDQFPDFDGPARDGGVVPILYLGRIEEDKGVRHLLDAFHHLDAKHPGGFRLDFAGDGTARAALENEVSTAGTGDRVHFHGHLHKDETRTLLKRAAILVVPTTSRFVEGFNKVVVEGWLARRFVIATSACPSALELGDEVRVIAPDSIDALVAALESAVSDLDRGEIPAPPSGPMREKLSTEAYSWAAALRRLLQERRSLGYLVPQFPSQTHAFFWRELSAMREQGNRIELLSTRPPVGEECHHEFAEAARKETIYLNRLHFSTFVLALRHPVRVLRALGYLATLRDTPWKARPALLGVLAGALRLREVAAEQRMDHIHLHSCADAGHLGALCRLLGGPSYSLTLHGDLKVYGLDHERKFAGASWVSAVTRPLREQIVAHTGMNRTHVPVIWMGVDTDRFAPADTADSATSAPAGNDNEGGDSQGLHLTTIARLIPQKGHLHALAAMRRVLDEGIPLRYTIAGSGPFEDAIREEIERLDLSGAVTMAGSIGENAVRSLLESADVFLLPSYGLGEAAPVSVMEAMSCGLPVICSRIGGTTDMIRHRIDGWLTDQQDEDQLYEAMKTFATDPDFRKEIGRAARERSLEVFDHRRNAGRLLQCITGRVEEVRDCTSDLALPS